MTEIIRGITDFGKAIKVRLMEMERTQNWLVEEVKKETGLSFDSFYLDRIMKGKAKYAGRPEEAICKILGIEKAKG